MAAGSAAGALAEAPSAGAGLIVKLREGGVRAHLAPAQRLERLGAEAGIELAYRRPMALGAHVVALPRGDAAGRAETLTAEIARHPDVEYVQVDRRRRARRTPNDEAVNGQTYLGNGSAGISAFAAWDVTTGAASTVIAVVDTGVLAHADLAGRVLPGGDFISDPQVANDGTGRDGDASDPGDWVSAADLEVPIFKGWDCEEGSSSWHGTSIAGVLASNTNNGQWTAGINWAAKILPVRVLGKCGGYDSDILDGIAWAGGLAVPGTPANANPAHVINLSLGGPGPCDAAYRSVFDAVLAHGATRAIVAAAGNESDEVVNHSPANCPQVIAVASATATGNLAQYSNFGSGIALAAPGGSHGTGFRTASIIAISNAGATVPTFDTLAQLGGTSFAAPMVAGVASLMLAVAPNLTPAQVRSLLVATTKPFPAASTCSTDLCGAGIVDAYAAVLAAQSVAPVVRNYEGLWYNAPAESEAGWGINFAHQGDVIFATWFTYEASGRAWWLTMTANKTAEGVYRGTLNQTRGPAFNTQPFNPALVIPAPVGEGTLSFTDANNGTLAYTVNGITQTKTITRQVFGPLPQCVFGAQPNLALATNYQDLWYAAPAESEAGWGVNFTHQGDIIFATWFTYDFDNNPLWLSGTARKAAPGIYTGTLNRTTAPAFNATPWNKNNLTSSQVGTYTLSFTNGNSGTFRYQLVLGSPPVTVDQTKPITRQVFRNPGTVCQ